MAFGQSPGPPASARQVQELLALLRDAGHADFRDARGPMGFTQRQGAGKFTRDEADALIEQLQDTSPDVNKPIMAAIADSPALSDVPAEQLAAELRRRGWTVIAP